MTAQICVQISVVSDVVVSPFKRFHSPILFSTPGQFIEYCIYFFVGNNQQLEIEYHALVHACICKTSLLPKCMKGKKIHY